MDANQERNRNPFGMDEACMHCDALCETRTQVVHGYGDVGADFLFVGEMPSQTADGAGVPFVPDGPGGRRLFELLDRLELVAGENEEGPAVDNIYLTNLTRCHHPDRGASAEEIRNCEAFLTAEIRMINPEIIVPVGSVALDRLVAEYTTDNPTAYEMSEVHATTLRGRGFELVPMRNPTDMTDVEATSFVEHFTDVMHSDYRQTKGRRRR